MVTVAPKRMVFNTPRSAHGDGHGWRLDPQKASGNKTCGLYFILFPQFQIGVLSKFFYT